MRDGGVESCGRKEHKTWATRKEMDKPKKITKLRVEHKHTQGKKEGGRLTEGCVWGGVRHEQTGVREYDRRGGGVRVEWGGAVGW